jgi:hypothetical protein
VRLISIVVVACVVTTTAAPAIAQERAWFWPGSSLTQLGVSNGGRDWALLDRITLPTFIPTSKPIAAGGGRYIVWTVQIPGTAAFTDSVLVWFDTRTRQASYLPSVTLHGQVTLGVDRRHGRLVVIDQSAIYLLTTGDRQITTIAFAAQGNEQLHLRLHAAACSSAGGGSESFFTHPLL